MAWVTRHGYREATYFDGVRERRAAKSRASAAAEALRGVEPGQLLRLELDTGTVVEGRFLTLRKKHRRELDQVLLNGGGDSLSSTPLLRIANLWVEHRA